MLSGPTRFLALLLALLPAPLFARASALCDQAAERASFATGVPVEVLRALTRTETGRSGPIGLEPWPWAVNQGGSGYWFDTAAEAESFVAMKVAAGIGNIDIGCFQLNYRWHGAAFSSLTAMFDPEINAHYAAGFLAEKYRETGDWVTAAGAYHSATTEHADRYEARFAEVLEGLSPYRVADLGPAPEAEVPRENLFPLLTAGEGAGTRGSLVPQLAARAALFRGAP
ncbi:Transglycosylase SLT domain-containing protein [Gemmobacter aquatilis]|uniref:Transglycosylase SLT domain-containing protein n=1 Tax=Gemmobacter aquatilis TaxID=933059 RepID=A0A1H7YL49_9RHOB|nr:transglycosylase SLT domain-containing protein [Gemmobacter aquatilis]SEM46982.1 Transglycosylase SLT domain-containing protein [Gemmobacter aquatilis]